VTTGDARDADTDGDADTEVLLDDVIFPEAPRWHDGRLWFSDFYGKVVRAVDMDGRSEEICRVLPQPSGLGWLPDGRLLVVSMIDRWVLRQEKGGQLVRHADLSPIATYHANDMVVDPQGRAYVGNFGFDFGGGEEHRTTPIALVHPDGRVEPASEEELTFPNGMVITPDGRTLIVCETLARGVSAFDIQPDGLLTNRRLFAWLPDRWPDGCCLDAEGALWVAVPPQRECIRVVEGGEVTHRVRTQRGCTACMLCGDDGRTLFLATTFFGIETVEPPDHLGRIEYTRVDIPAAGLP
jgi:sugar lactone lactonase YvrE